MARVFLSRRQAADMMGLKSGTLSNWYTKGIGPKVYNPSGGKALYLQEEVENFILGINNAPPKPRRGRPPGSGRRT